MRNEFEFCEDTDIVAIDCLEWCIAFHDEVRLATIDNTRRYYNDIAFNVELTRIALEKYDAIAFYRPRGGDWYCLRFKDNKAKLQFLIKHG